MHVDADVARLGARQFAIDIQAFWALPCCCNAKAWPNKAAEFFEPRSGFLIGVLTLGGGKDAMMSMRRRWWLRKLAFRRNHCAASCVS